MKSRVLLAFALAVPLGLLAMPTAVENLPSKITLPQAVKLGDGSVLPAGQYDVQIEYRGYGSAAELHFFQRGVFKGKAPAVARGFTAQAPVAVNGPGATVEKDKVSGPLADKSSAAATRGEKWTGLQKVSPGAFSWGAYGFKPGSQGNVFAGPSSLKLQFDSSNSAAGFSAILPYIEKARK